MVAVLFSYVVDERAETACSMMAKEPVTRTAVVNRLWVELNTPTAADHRKAIAKARETWGLGAPGNEAEEILPPETE